MLRLVCIGHGSLEALLLECTGEEDSQGAAADYDIILGLRAFLVRLSVNERGNILRPSLLHDDLLSRVQLSYSYRHAAGFRVVKLLVPIGP